MRIKIGFIAIAEPLPDLKAARDKLRKSIKMLERMDVDVVAVHDIVTELEEVVKEARRFRREEVDLFIIQWGAWAPDEFAISMTREIDAPFILWTIPEDLRGGFPDGGLVGLTQTGGTLSKMGKRFARPEVLLTFLILL